MEEAPSLLFFGRFLACRSDCPVAGELRRDFDLATSHDSFKSRSTLEVDGRQACLRVERSGSRGGLEAVAEVPLT